MYNSHIFIKNKEIVKWFIEGTKNNVKHLNFAYHDSMFSLRNELDLKSNKKKLIVVVEIDDINIIVFTKKYVKSHPNLLFLGIGFEKNIDEINLLLKSNFRGYLDITSKLSNFLIAFEEIWEGSYFIDNKTSNVVVQRYFTNLANNQNESEYNFNLNFSSNHLAIGSLTEKQKKVTELLAQGLTYKRIASMLGVSTYTINQNARSIFKKLNVRSRAELSFKLLS